MAEKWEDIVANYEKIMGYSMAPRQEQVVRGFFNQQLGIFPSRKARRPKMIAAVFLFGPCHGTTMVWERLDRNKSQYYLLENQENVVFDLDDERLPSPMVHMPKRHIYDLYDIVESGIEECAIFFHSENCCERTYADKKYNKPYIRPF